MTKRRKLLLGILIPVLIVAVFLTLFLSIVFQGHNIRVKGVGATDGGFDNVLSNIKDIVEANPRIVDIAMLGGHGVSSYNIKYGGKLGLSDVNTPLGKADPLVKGFTFRFSKTQTVDVRTLLGQGARYLQIKCSVYDGKWWAEHAILSVGLDTVIKDLLDFLQSTKGEVVLPLFEPVYLGEGGTMADLHDYIMSVTLNGKSLKDYVYYSAANTFGKEDGEGVDISELRYNDITQNGTKSGVVLLDSPDDEKLDIDAVYSSVGEFGDLFFDEDSVAFHPWHHRFDSDLLLKMIDAAAEEASKPEYADKLRVNQTQGAFNTHIEDFCDMLGDWSLIDFANKHNVRVLENKNFDKWLKAMPIVHFDFANCNNKDFNARINQKIIEYNRNLVNELLAH